MNAITTLQPQPMMDEGWIIRAWTGKQRSIHTRRAYEADKDQFLTYAAVPLSQVTLDVVTGFGDYLTDDLGLSPASVARRLSSVKSLLKFATDWHLFPVDFGRYVKLPAVKDTLAERIMSRSEVLALLDADQYPRNGTMLRLLYNAGLRVSECVSLCWRDCVENGDSGQITVLGKGGKTRAILLAAHMWHRLQSLRNASNADLDTPVFQSRQGGPLTPMQVHRIVKDAAKRAGINDAVSCHWLRHAHASIALQNGADVNLVRTTLGHASLETTTRYCHVRPNDSSARYL